METCIKTPWARLGHKWPVSLYVANKKSPILRGLENFHHQMTAIVPSFIPTVRSALEFLPAIACGCRRWQAGHQIVSF